MNSPELIQVTSENYQSFAFCGYKNPKRPGYSEKTHWLLERFKEGLQVWVVQAGKDGTQGMIEYVPGKYCWRPLVAENCMVIHCLFMGFKKTYKGQGWGTRLIQQCEADAKREKLAGVAVVVREGAFMADESIFAKLGYGVVDQAPPDFKLMAKMFSPKAVLPKFSPGLNKVPKAWGEGLVILRADQCPYTVTNVKEMVDVAKTRFKLTAKVITITSAAKAQQIPNPFGTFAVMYNGEIVAHHPISATRFGNIMAKCTAVK